jgi:hypothetical protein
MTVFNDFVDGLQMFFFGIWLWMGKTIMGWQYVDVYAPGNDKDPEAKVMGVTFANDEKYINKVADIELEG